MNLYLFDCPNLEYIPGNIVQRLRTSPNLAKIHSAVNCYCVQLVIPVRPFYITEYSREEVAKINEKDWANKFLRRGLFVMYCNERLIRVLHSLIYEQAPELKFLISLGQIAVK